MKELLTDSSMSVGILSMLITFLPLWLGVILLVWIVRFIRSLREKLDSIEDKLELLVLAQQLEFAKKSPEAKTTKPE